ncbi:MAG: 23S rRNA (guanosine(2251)-2'-O)-methyltransferase RlmB, partial [Proteobacteria bacterium]|nr:23S rRNA (guanosine(2251)-2'-O)-methyltransferase RlmB [Pseudomonadota bacterium]
MKNHPHLLFGKHAALAALENPMRKIKRVLVTKGTQAELAGKLGRLKNVSVVEGQKLEQMLPPGSVHQGIAVECEKLAQPSLQHWLAEDANKPILLLDQVSDPHNVGAILRSAAAFDVGAVVVTDRGAPEESGVMAKSASGAVEVVPLISVVNLVQAIEAIKKAGYWIYGLDGSAKETIGQAKMDAKTALVLGAEGAGLRRLTQEHCDFLVKLPISPQMESLNVSNAAAVALYDLYRRLV